MNVLKTQILLELKIETKEELVNIVNYLLQHDITDYLIVKDMQSLISKTSYVNSSSIESGTYTLSVYSKNIKDLAVLDNLIK